ncbi:hypothetical protein [Brachybacterium vulturis]|nr:hypothetical protein [Brachybacterium vulturis]
MAQPVNLTPPAGATKNLVVPARRRFSRLSIARRPMWWGLVLAVVVAPTLVAASMGAGSILDSPMTLFSLSFEIQALIGPLLVVALYVVPISEQFTNGWFLYTRTRQDLRHRLLALTLHSTAIPAAVMMAATLLSALYAFGFGPFGVALPGPSSSDYATFTQLTAASGILYVAVVVMWQGLWAAIFSLVAFGLLLLTGRRAVAFAIPLVLYWVDNAVIGAAGQASFRSVSSINPFTVTQSPIWTAAVPLLWWVGILVMLAALLHHRRGEVTTLL